MDIHQIWIGGKMPKRDKSDVAGIRGRAKAAGHTHRLWKYDDIEIPEHAAEALWKAQDMLPHTMFSSIVTDYYRMKLLGAKPGSVYMDTDVVCTVPEFPEFPEGADIYACTTSNGKTINTCILYAATELGSRGCAVAADIVLSKLKLLFKDGGDGMAEKLVEELKAQPYSLANFVGPIFFRDVCMPVLARGGVRLELFDLSFAATRRKDAKLCHRGSGKWCFGGNGNPYYKEDAQL